MLYRFLAFLKEKKREAFLREFIGDDPRPIRPFEMNACLASSTVQLPTDCLLVKACLSWWTKSLPDVSKIDPCSRALPKVVLVVFKSIQDHK